jgi:hypothetical protein
MFDPVEGITEMLGELVSKGFRFTHPRDACGSLLAIQGVRAHDNVIDVVVMRAEDEAKAVRMPADEPDILRPATTLWQTAGQAYPVLLSLLMLADRTVPQPGDGAEGCWMPTRPGHAIWVRATTN